MGGAAEIRVWGGCPGRVGGSTGGRFRDSGEGVGATSLEVVLGRQDREAAGQGHTRGLALVLRTTRGLKRGSEGGGVGTRRC